MLKAVLHINEDNSKMKSKLTKEAQVISGKTIINILKETITQSGEIIVQQSIDETMEHVVFFMGNAALVDLKEMTDTFDQYPDDLIFFKDAQESPLALYVPGKVLNKHLEVIKGDWTDFSELLTQLEVTYRVEYLDDLIAVFSKHDLSYVSKGIQHYINNKLIDDGVTFVDLDSTYIDFDVKIGLDTIVYPNTFLTGHTVIGEDCIIGPDARIEDSVIGSKTSVKDSTISQSEVANETSVGPYAYIRPNSKVGSHVKIGDFVEIKNATIDDGTKISHLSYVGDADLGKHVNVGCGVVFVNYNGKEKSRSTIKDNVFIGCNSNLVSPIVVEELAYIAAGTTVTKNVPSGALAVGRAKQSNKEGWVEKRQLISKK